MWIIQEQKKVAPWNKRHFEEKNEECAACLKYSVLIFVEKIYIKCNIWRVAVRLSYIWDARFLKVKHQPSNAWTSSAMLQTTTQLMVQFPAPRSLYLVQGSLDRIFVSHPATHTYIVKPSATRRSLCTIWMAYERFTSSVHEACPSIVYMYNSLHISVIMWDWQKHHEQWNTNIKIQFIFFFLI